MCSYASCFGPRPLTSGEFHNLKVFFEEDQKKNPGDYGLVINDHHQIPGNYSNANVPLTP